MPVYTKLYGLFFLGISIILFCFSYFFRRSKDRPASTRLFLLGASLIFYAYAGVKFIPALFYVVLVTL